MYRIAAKETIHSNVLMVTVASRPTVTHGSTENNFHVEGLGLKMPTKIGRGGNAVAKILRSENIHSLLYMGVPILAALGKTPLINK